MTCLKSVVLSLLVLFLESDTKQVAGFQPRIQHGGLSAIQSKSSAGSSSDVWSSRLMMSPRPISSCALSESDKELEDIFDFDPTAEPIIIRGSDADDIDGSIWEDLETGEPPKWLVMKEVSLVYGAILTSQLADTEPDFLFALYFVAVAGH